ncbi:probable BOI-related E3 ubiquitin-protein ligase 3 [Gastrolobium bilobum]|uniref:probable BOI-related E3 ubiquitin-protein ligase 3 n=1 Tax=Gastrolobium bilobum TaxID=150636 RepID=UPI002AB03124|nr:probable BOI-related E3 ubiquitin-protein ligase 3 [Gastrolobium bilobum]
MAIQAHMYPSNVSSSFYNNGYCNVGLLESQFNSQQKHDQQQQQQLEEPLQQLHNESWLRQVDSNLLVYDSKALNSPSFVVQLEKQWEEIDQYIRFQNEKLRFMLQEQHKQQVAALLKIVESRSLYILKQKDEEIEQVARKMAELEDFLRRLEMENKEWKKVAQEKEAMVSWLNKTLEEMRERVANDAESCCDERSGKELEEEGIAEYSGAQVMLCKSCHSRRSCFLFLPCRHLCSCKACDAFLEACPVCRMPKKASIETLIF